MPSDPRAVQARELHQRAAESERLAGVCRDGRNRLIRELSHEGWTHAQVAAAIGCSVHLVTSVVMGRVGPGTRGRQQGGRRG
jgi:hypothetical protein